MKLVITKDSWKSCTNSPIARLSEALDSLPPGGVLEVVAEEDYLPLETLIFVLENRGNFTILDVEKAEKTFTAKIARG